MKAILFCVIVVCAGAVLAKSIIRKSHKAQEPAKANYAATLSSNSSPIIKKDSLSSITTEKPAESFIPLPSLSALDQLAAGYDGVFVLLIKKEAEKTEAMIKEVKDAINAIAVQGVRMGAFQLNSGAQEFSMLTAQLPPPGVLVIMKGRGIRGVTGNDINQPKLLQACIAAMLPSGCGPGSCRSGSSACKPTPGCK